jgi:hypothetical protein
MAIVTRDDLVRAVTALRRTGEELVRGTDVIKWCALQRPRLDCGEDERPVNAFLWDADLDERRNRGRLLKFKTSRTKGGRVLWGLASGAAQVRAEARRLKRVEVPWDAEAPSPRGGEGGNWNWQGAEIP